MPILHIQITGNATDANGQAVPVSDNVALVHRGPVLQVAVSVAQPVAEQLLQQGQAIPPPITGLALIDTGATSTCIDDQAAQQLGLPAIDVVTIASASHDATQQNVYPIQMEFVGVGFNLNVPRAIGATLQAQGLLVLLGRDALYDSVLIYNGMTGQITFSR